VPEIFVSYRLQDHPVYAALLDRELGRRFGPDTVFLAPRSIPPGADFLEAIVTAVRSSAVLIAVIGPNWLSPPGPRRPYAGVDDWVRREIAEALAAGVRVVPVLVGDAGLPVESELPPDIVALARCQSVRLGDDTLMSDVDGLGAALAPVVESRLGAGPGRRALFELDGPGAPACRLGIAPGGIQGVRDVDVWVNSENTDMEMSRITEFSVSGIIRYFGSRRDPAGGVVADLIATELASRVERRPVAPGTAIVTGSGALAESNGVRYVVHVAAAQGEPGSGFRPVRNLGRCVDNVLRAADALAATDERVRSVLLPLLGTGVAGGEPEPTAAVLVAAAVDYLVRTPRTGLTTVWFLAYDRTEHLALLNAFRARPELVPASGPRGTTDAD
jgi:O-acetyl-ADP-ribose deacetylase (regulator of RNase III)